MHYLSATYPLRTANNPIRVEASKNTLKVWALSMWGGGGVGETPACLGNEEELSMLAFPASQELTQKDYFFRKILLHIKKRC